MSMEEPRAHMGESIESIAVKLQSNCYQIPAHTNVPERDRIYTVQTLKPMEKELSGMT
jgi:hypothetical protein